MRFPRQKRGAALEDIERIYRLEFKAFQQLATTVSGEAKKPGTSFRMPSQRQWRRARAIAAMDHSRRGCGERSCGRR
jgi:hypothetical protein